MLGGEMQSLLEQHRLCMDQSVSDFSCINNYRSLMQT